MKIQFTKMTAAGNDFVVLDDRKNGLRNLPHIARRLCDRRFGIGADGMIVVRNSRIGAYRMLYYNSDGSTGGMCGNGGRCIAAFARRKGIAREKHTFEAFGHTYKATVKKSGVSLEMKDVTSIEVKKLRTKGKSILCYVIDTGAPHIVIPYGGSTERFQVFDIADEARPLRYHPAFSPAGVNVSYIRMLRPGMIEMRTYERGVENETLACGTGSVASAIASRRHYGFGSNVKVVTRSGKVFRISMKYDKGSYKGVRLAGPAGFVFEGSIEI